MSINISQPQASIPMMDNSNRPMPQWMLFFQAVWNYMFLNNGVLKPYDPTTGNDNSGNIVRIINASLSGPLNISLTPFSTRGAYNGRYLRFIRTNLSQGNYAVNFKGTAGTVIGNLNAPSTWIDFHYDGTEWNVTASGIWNPQFYPVNTQIFVTTMAGGNVTQTLPQLQAYNVGSITRYTRTETAIGPYSLFIKNWDGTTLATLNYPAQSADFFWNGTNWVNTGTLSYAAIPYITYSTIFYALALGSDTPITLPSLNSYNAGTTVRYIRTAASIGNYSLVFKDSGANVIGKLGQASTWIDFYWDGTNWFTTAGGLWNANYYPTNTTSFYNDPLSGDIHLTLPQLPTSAVGSTVRVWRTSNSNDVHTLFVDNWNGVNLQKILTANYMDVYYNGFNWFGTNVGTTT